MKTIENFCKVRIFWLIIIVFWLIMMGVIFYRTNDYGALIFGGGLAVMYYVSKRQEYFEFITKRSHEKFIDIMNL